MFFFILIPLLIINVFIRTRKKERLTPIPPTQELPTVMDYTSLFPPRHPSSSSSSPIIPAGSTGNVSHTSTVASNRSKLRKQALPRGNNNEKREKARKSGRRRDKRAEKREERIEKRQESNKISRCRSRHGAFIRDPSSQCGGPGHPSRFWKKEREREGERQA